MNADIVVDVGNTRIKWGRCSSERVEETIALAHGETQAWLDALTSWRFARPYTWIVAGVNPRQRDLFAGWLRQQNQIVHLLDKPEALPLIVKLERPDHVGIDRLLDAVAVNTRRPAGRPAVVIDAGSAITVDWLDETGAFCGGAIIPGARLMSRALHDYTALLPLVEIKTAGVAVPGRSTPAAVEAGVFWAVAGGVKAVLDEMAKMSRHAPALFLTGGDAGLLAAALGSEVLVWPELTLEGTRLAVSRL